MDYEKGGEGGTLDWIRVTRGHAGMGQGYIKQIEILDYGRREDCGTMEWLRVT